MQGCNLLWLHLYESNMLCDSTDRSDTLGGERVANSCTFAGPFPESIAVMLL